MKTVWVILNETKDVILEVFETVEADSKPHWGKFYQYRPGCVFCGRVRMNPYKKTIDPGLDWYYNYFYWDDQSRWGLDSPNGIAWSAAMTLPEPIKMLEFVRG
jgi:hypothetical protein